MIPVSLTVPTLFFKYSHLNSLLIKNMAEPDIYHHTTKNVAEVEEYTFYECQSLISITHLSTQFLQKNLGTYLNVAVATLYIPLYPNRKQEHLHF